MKVTRSFFVNLSTAEDKKLIEKLRTAMEKKINTVIPGFRLSNADLIRMCMRRELERLKK
jgi:hypothetical protein